MLRAFCIRRFAPLLLLFCLGYSIVSAQAPIAVRYKEGLVHGFLVLRTQEGEIIAAGDMTQIVQGDRVTNHLVFHFKDGSLQDETVVFTQRRTFRLVSDRLLQKGPAFKRPIDLSIDAAKGQASVRYSDDSGKEKFESQHLRLPADLANGMVLMLMKNLTPGAAETTLSIVVATPKPRLVKLNITPREEDPFSIAGSAHKATHYKVKTEISGVAGLVAPLVGKKPPDTDVWVLGGEAPAFIKSEGPFYVDGPIWQVELTSPVWSQTAAANSQPPPN